GSGVRSEVPSEALNLTVLIVNDGYSLKASNGNIAPGCQGPGPGVAIPLKNGKYDPDSLTVCAARLKASSPDFADENQVYITANPGTDYQSIVDVIDALRLTPQGDALFDNVNFKVPK
ncbi:MAG TPA: biopolymer transporter ExbD, partial [Polyangiaceae bacterium]|nr:biopolymer transporter ExbD [Polyangiaceae bacterium]